MIQASSAWKCSEANRDATKATIYIQVFNEERTTRENQPKNHLCGFFNMWAKIREKENSKIWINKNNFFLQFYYQMWPIMTYKPTPDCWLKAVRSWHWLINPLWSNLKVLLLKAQQLQNYIKPQEFNTWNFEHVILSWQRHISLLDASKKRWAARLLEHCKLKEDRVQPAAASLHLPWFFSLNRFFVAGRNISINSGTFLMTWTAHNAAC